MKREARISVHGPMAIEKAREVRKVLAGLIDNNVEIETEPIDLELCDKQLDKLRDVECLLSEQVDELEDSWEGDGSSEKTIRSQISTIRKWVSKIEKTFAAYRQAVDELEDSIPAEVEKAKAS